MRQLCIDHAAHVIGAHTYGIVVAILPGAHGDTRVLLRGNDGGLTSYRIHELETA